MASLNYHGVTGPVPPGLFPTLTVGLLIAGLVASTLFYVREETASGGRRRRSIASEALLAAVASGCLGWGIVFLLLWCGVYLG